MAGFDETDPFLRALRQLEQQLPQQPAPEPSQPERFGDAATYSAELLPPAEGMGIGLFYADQLPAAATNRLPARRDPISEKNWGKRLGVAALVIAVGGGAVAEGINLLSNDSTSVAAVGHHGKHHWQQYKDHKNQQGTTETDKTVNTPPNPSSASSAPDVAASPSTDTSKIKSYVLTIPSAQTTPTSEAPTSTPTATPTNKPEASSGNGGAAFNFKIGTQNQKNHLSNEAHKAALKLIFKHHIDIDGTQETGWHKYSFDRRILKNHNYGVFPRTHYKAWNQLCSRDVAIFYNKDKFKPIKHEFLSFPQYPLPAVEHCGHGESAEAGHANAPIVWFKDKETGREIIVMNTHNEANVKMAKGSRPARVRYHASKIYMRKIKELQEKYPDVPIFLTGDMNEGTGVRTSRNVTLEADPDKLLSHMMKQTGLMKDASCMNKACHYHSIGGVDFIYVQPGVRVRNFWTVSSGRASHSDHPFKYTKVTIPKSFGSNG
jgi:hypothetical protein